MNSKLIPVKRLNKNGVLVTKHVLPDAASTSDKAMPAPSLGAQSAKAKAPKLSKDEKRLAARIKNLDKSRTRRIVRDETPLYANHPLRPMYKDAYTVKGTDNEFYSLVERLHPDDAVVLSHHGLKPSQLDAFIINNNYQFYEQDNRELVAKLRARGIPAKDFILARGQFYENGEDKMLDAAECSAIYAGSFYGDKYGARDTLTRYVGQGTVLLEDIKNIGTERVANDIGTHSRLLLRLKRGEAVATSLEIRDMLERAGEKADDGLRGSLMSRTAIRFGVEFTESLRFTNMIFYSEEEADKLPVDEAMSFMRYVDDATAEEPKSVMNASTPMIDMKPYRELWEAGVNPEVARDGLERGMTALQIIAVDKEGITPSVSDGWL